MKQLAPLSRAMKLLLLERAVLAMHDRYGLPSNQEEQAFFDSEVSILYRCCLIARRSAPPRSFESAARTQVILKYAAKHGAAAAERESNLSCYVRSLEILAGET